MRAPCVVRVLGNSRMKRTRKNVWPEKCAQREAACGRETSASADKRSSAECTARVYCVCVYHTMTAPQMISFLCKCVRFYGRASIGESQKHRPCWLGQHTHTRPTATIKIAAQTKTTTTWPLYQQTNDAFLRVCASVRAVIGR